MSDNSERREALETFGQDHLLAFWDSLSESGRQRLAAQIDALDLPLMQKLYRGQEAAADWAALAARAESPRAIRLGDPDPLVPAEQARQRGAAALQAGEVAMILVAGGQGSRLGFHQPKGMFPLGPVSNRTLFAIFIDRLRAMSRHYRATIPLYVMTSPATDAATRTFFREQQNLGLEDDAVRFFCQGVMPAVSAETGKILLAERDAIALSPDGHGGMLSALQRSGCLDEARERGIRMFFYGQVDNPLLQICDPYFLGAHLKAESEMTTQVICKQDPYERVGNVIQVDGRTQIIEYSDLPDNVAKQRDDTGRLRLWAGSIAVHVFDRAFLERVAKASDGLPFHRAHKKVAHVGADGLPVATDTPNAFKFEKFIFDLLPSAENAFVVEVANEEAFAPVKNANSAPEDTASTARAAMVRKDTALLDEAGIAVAPGTLVEVNPLWALDAAAAARQAPRQQPIDQPTYFGPDNAA